MNVFIDFEFIDDGATIEPISVGMVREDGETYYAIIPFDASNADDWVQKNVIDTLESESEVPRKPKQQVADEIVEFCGLTPTFWGYFCDYDWVLLCQFYGKMIDLPNGWPMFCMDLKQLQVVLGGPKLPTQRGRVHNALADAQWIASAHRFLVSEVGRGSAKLAL